MRSPEATSLRDALRQAGDLHGRRLFGREADLALDDALGRTCLEGARDGLAGRNVLLATADQLTTAAALIELDGIAARIVLCPPDLKGEHLAALVERAGIDAIVTDDAADPLPDVGGVPVVRCALPDTPANPATGEPRATEWLLLTSGTTGVPKMVQHGFAGLTAAMKPQPDSARPPVWATFYDIRRYGGLQILLRALLGSGSMLLSSAQEPVSDALRRFARHGVTQISGTPSHWRRALMSPALSAIRPDYVRLSGEIADQAVLDSLRHAFPQARIGHAYASTEAGVGFEVDDGREGFPTAFLGHRGDVEMTVVDGSLRIRSSRTASRYVGSEGLALATDDGFIDTGDMVEERGDRYYFVGRRGGIINVGGMKVHPEEVEAVINRHAGVRMSLVEGRRSPIVGAIVVAAVVLDEAEAAGSSDGLRQAILQACRDALPPHKVPAVLRFVPSLAVTAAGKLVRAHA